MSQLPIQAAPGTQMKTVGFGATSEGGWRDLYLAALFEVDTARLPERIAKAEYALSLRARELWYSEGDHHNEKLALTSAMQALEALRNIHQCPRLSPTLVKRAPEPSV
jgi:hypothetical protein